MPTDWKTLKNLPLSTLLDLALHDTEVYKKLPRHLIDILFAPENGKNLFEIRWEDETTARALLAHPKINEHDKRQVLKVAVEQRFMQTTPAVPELQTSPSVLALLGNSPYDSALRYMLEHNQIGLAQGWLNAQHTIRQVVWDANAEAIIGVMLAAETDPNAASKNDYETALYCAAEFGKLSVVHMLQNAGVRLDAANKAGETALHLAAKYDHADIVQALLAAQVDFNAKSLDDKTALDLAVAGGHEGVVNLLLDAGARSDNDALLRLAIKKDYPAMAKLLLRDSKWDEKAFQLAVQLVENRHPTHTVQRFIIALLEKHIAKINGDTAQCGAGLFALKAVDTSHPLTKGMQARAEKILLRVLEGRENPDNLKPFQETLEKGEIGGLYKVAQQQFPERFEAATTEVENNNDAVIQRRF